MNEAVASESPAGHRAGGACGRSSAGRGRRGYFVPGIIALAALLVIGGALGAGDLFHSAPRTLAGPAVASEIALGVQAERGASSPPVVTCPASEPVRMGLRFTCALHLAGRAPTTVAVQEIDGRGHLRWSLPPTLG